jgi:C4-dicarboxylate transporter, DctM subunit
MSVLLITILVLAAFLVFAILGTPLAYSLLLAGTLGLILLDGVEGAAFELGAAPYGTAASYFLLLIPVYVLIGMLVANGGLAQKVYRVASHLLRWLPGGVGVATVVACAGFAAVTGSSIATVATIGRTAVDEMVEFGIKARTAAGLVAAAGTLGALIPPSVVLVLYGFISGESIGKLLLAGIIPGIVVAVVYSVYLMIAERDHGVKQLATQREEVLVGVGAAAGAESSSGTWGRVPTSALSEAIDEQARPLGDGGGADAQGGAVAAPAKRERVPYEAALYIVLIFGVVVGGMYSGLFTVVESGAIGVVLALVIIIIEARRNRQSIMALLRDSLAESMSVMSMVFGLLLGGGVLAMFFVSTRLPNELSAWATGLDIPPMVLVILLLAILIPLGMFLEPMSIILILVPIYHPIVTALGFDGIWFAILFVRMIEVAMITPPVGLNVFVIAGVAKGVSVEQVFRGVFPFILLDFLCVGLFMVFPEIITFLPSMANA